VTGLRRLVSQTVHEEARISSRRYEQRACLTTEALGEIHRHRERGGLPTIGLMGSPSFNIPDHLLSSLALSHSWGILFQNSVKATRGRLTIPATGFR